MKGRNRTRAARGTRIPSTVLCYWQVN